MTHNQKIAVAVAGIGLALVLAVFAFKPAANPITKDCTPGTCKVSVIVNSCNPGGIAVGPNETHIGVSAVNHIVWEIASGPYVFADRPGASDDGIVIVNPPFFRQGVSGGGGKFTVKDDYRGPGGPYKYTITILNAADKSLCGQYDPYISNR
jgi:hypothetical protein